MIDAGTQGQRVSMFSSNFGNWYNMSSVVNSHATGSSVPWRRLLALVALLFSIVIQGCIQGSTDDTIKPGLPPRAGLHRDQTEISNELGAQMVLLKIDLQDGFADETVVIDVAGKEVFRKGNIKTNYAIGLAESITVELPKGELHVTVSLPERNISNFYSGEISEPVYLGISLSSDGIIEFSPFREAFKYR